MAALQADRYVIALSTASTSVFRCAGATCPTTALASTTASGLLAPYSPATLAPVTNLRVDVVYSLATASTVMVNVLVLLSEPPSAMPPLSCAITVTVAAPKVLAAGVNVSVPLSATLGGTLNNAALSLLVVTLVTLWPDSFAEPAVKVAKPLTE